MTSQTGIGAWIALACCVAALFPAGSRWLRVAQREHYLAGSVTRFAARWWGGSALDLATLGLAVVGLGLSAVWPLAAVATAAAVVVAPWRLSVRGRTSPLGVTRRLRTLAAVWIVLQAVVVVVGVVSGAPAPLAAAGAVVVPVLVDLALAVTAPVERRLSRHFVEAAAEKLRRIGPVIVAVTGSYGKTSTKNHIAHLVAGRRTVVASPASFNNRGGLARAVNEHLSDGTEVFVAEMGTYGPGEIADLCRWCPPSISVITAIGPVHLERFGTEDRIVVAKAEITETATTVVLNVDDRRLADLADRLASGPGAKRVVRCSATDPGADVVVSRHDGAVSVRVAGEPVGGEVALREGLQPTNLACAVAVALELGVPAEVAVARLGQLPEVPNRLTVGTAPSGVTVIDDTYNSNPAGARAALDLLERVGNGGRRVVVTPGMVELGPKQAEENRAFAARASRLATDLVVVGRTNRRALRQGADGRAPVLVGTRDEAVRWVREHLGAGDAVLYENDLPDHYP